MRSWTVHFIQERLEKYLKDSQTCETLKFGADLAKDYHKYSENILSRTRQLVSWFLSAHLNVSYIPYYCRYFELRFHLILFVWSFNL